MKEKNTKLVDVALSEALLIKLAWAYPHGTNEQRVEFVIEEAINEAEQEEGVVYPEDRLPGGNFDHVTIIS